MENENGFLVLLSFSYCEVLMLVGCVRRAHNKVSFSKWKCGHNVIVVEMHFMRWTQHRCTVEWNNSVFHADSEVESCYDGVFSHSCFHFHFYLYFHYFFNLVIATSTQSDYECGFFFAFSLFLSFVRIIKWYFSQQFSVAIVMTDHIALGSHFYSQLRIKCFLCRTHIKRRSNFFSITTNQNVSCSTQLKTSWISLQHYFPINVGIFLAMIYNDIFFCIRFRLKFK